ncbi:MAG: hypothetical protein DRP62_01090 [Planctomycetota bacterium]|nr:MAG: hypothetical protein DRP62_01090 [Planctomycetota bacterium]
MSDDFAGIFCLKFEGFLITVCFRKTASCLWFKFFLMKALCHNKELFQWGCEKCVLNMARPRVAWLNKLMLVGNYA